MSHDKKSVLDFHKVPIHVGDKVSCEVPIDGFLTKDKNYTVVDLRPDEGRITLTDDRGYEMWANGNRFRIWLTSEELYFRVKEIGLEDHEIVKIEQEVFGS